jgi:hypothetical protein
MNIESNLKIIIMLIFTINIYLMVVACIIAYTLKNAFTMYNKKLNYIKNLIIQTKKINKNKNKNKKRTKEIK